MLIINERTAVNRILSGDASDYKASQIVSLLCRYYIKVENKSTSETKKLVSDYLKCDMCRVDYADWDNFMDKSIKIAKETNFKEVECVPITQNEINFIKGFSNKLQKLVFTIIVLGKFSYITKGNTWINENLYNIFESAHVVSNAVDRDYIIHDLYVKGVVGLSDKIDNTSFKSEIIDIDGKCVFEVTDLNDLGLWWLKFKGENYRVCKTCGKIFKPTGKRDLCCKNHRGYQKCAPKKEICCDCGKPFLNTGRQKSKRCDACQWEYKKLSMRNSLKKSRQGT